jgi:hypothetical protein
VIFSGGNYKASEIAPMGERGEERRTRGGHRHLQIGRMLDIDLISEPPHTPTPQVYVYKVWESVWSEGQKAIHS